MRVKLLSVMLLALLLGACGSPKDIIYFQGVDALTPEQISKMSQTYEMKIMPSDMLNITVTAWDPTVTTPFNPPVYAYAQQGEQATNSSQTMYNYLVDNEGYINFPVIGKVKVEGLTRNEVSELLTEKISKYIKDPLVRVELINFKVTVMGEINRPGAFTIKNDRVSVLDVVGLAGDLTISANRKNILIIRDNKGEKEFARVDLTDPSIFESPYFYLRQNDVVYVEPNQTKIKNSRYSQTKQYNISVFSSIISAVSIITSMVISLVSLSNRK